jgi:hypothetical protein
MDSKHSRELQADLNATQTFIAPRTLRFERPDRVEAARPWRRLQHGDQLLALTNEEAANDFTRIAAI